MKTCYINGWIKEFYPVEASEVSKKNALLHSLRKWRGLTKENLSKHGLSSSPIPIDSGSCALCYYYINDECKKCPLYILRNGISCDELTEDETNSPYGYFLDEKDPTLMIDLLEEASKTKNKRVNKTK